MVMPRRQTEQPLPVAGSVPQARCMQLAATQSGVGLPETLAQARDNLQEIARNEASSRGWPTTLVRRAEAQRCSPQTFLPLFGLGYDCIVRANFCVR